MRLPPYRQAVPCEVRDRGQHSSLEGHLLSSAADVGGGGIRLRLLATFAHCLKGLG